MPFLAVLFCIPYHTVFLIPIPNYSLVPRFKQLHNMKGPSLTPRPPSAVVLGIVSGRQTVDVVMGEGKGGEEGGGAIPDKGPQGLLL